MDNVVAQLREIPQDKQVVSLPAPIPKCYIFQLQIFLKSKRGGY